jgi:hypothetical protein
MKRLNQAPPLLSTTPSSAPTICFNNMRIHPHTLSGNQTLAYGVVQETFTLGDGIGLKNKWPISYAKLMSSLVWYGLLRPCSNTFNRRHEYMIFYIVDEDGRYFTQNGNVPGFTANIELAYCYDDRDVNVHDVIVRLNQMFGVNCTTETRFKTKKIN